MSSIHWLPPGPVEFRKGLFNKTHPARNGARSKDSGTYKNDMIGKRIWNLLISRRFQTWKRIGEQAQ